MFYKLEVSKIFSITSKAPRYVLFIFLIVLAIGISEALYFSPEDYKQSHAVRIMYVHVPAAWISIGIFTFDKEKAADDLNYENIIIDKTSADLLKGSEIDYVSELIGEQFKITNPQTKSSCGCGVSFSL